jgi:maltooligosyltrehalose trehalohydrolase
MELRVWAPFARHVELDLAGRVVAMHAEARGWWAIDVSDVGPGTEYGYRLDGSDPLPDPRSASQPEGVHGLSRLVDHDGFPWTDHDWHGAHLPSLVIYELHIGTFSEEGTFDGAILRLDHLVELGVNAVEMMPVAEFPGDRNWGYDGVDLYAPHSAYGGPDGMKRFVDACHRRGLAVVLDVVYNHLGPEGNYLGRFGPYFTTSMPRRGATPSTTTVPAVTRCGGSSSKTPSCGCATTTSTVYASMRCTPSSTPAPCTCWRSWRPRSRP